MAISTAIVGVTGAVGTEFLKIIEQRDFPADPIKFLASARSAGKKVTFRGREYPVEELTESSFEGVELAMFSAGGGISKQFAPIAVKAGAVVVDNSSAFRMDPEVPLVVPEVNSQDIDNHKGIIANPNCSTIIMVVPVWPIYQAVGVKRIVVSTYQAASGAGARAMQELIDHSRDVLDGKEVEPKIMPHRLAFNVFSHTSPIGPEGYNQEEMKMVNETRKMFHDDAIAITATCVRVPVLRAHAEAINLTLGGEMNESEATDVLSRAPGVNIVDNREANYFPMPIDASEKDNILVGRIRRDLSQPAGRGLDLFVCGDQLLKGAALNAVQIAEKLL